jgi:hypothetical protein
MEGPNGPVPIVRPFGPIISKYGMWTEETKPLLVKG